MTEIDENFIVKNTQRGNPTIRGVYFLIYKKELIYIGSSDDIAKRLKQHRKSSFFRFDSYSIYPAHNREKNIKTVEKTCIQKFKPKYNCMYNPDYEAGIKRVWFTFIKHWKSYDLVAKECGVSVGSVKRVVNEHPKKWDNIELINQTILSREKNIIAPGLAPPRFR